MCGSWLTEVTRFSRRTLEQGTRFAASAAQGTLLGLVAVAVFAWVYAWTCTWSKWWLSLLLAWAAFAGATAVLYQARIGLILGLVFVAMASLSAFRLLPSPQSGPASNPTSAWDLPLRMMAAAASVLVLTSVAGQLGPALSGLLTPFPVATAIIAAFTHAERGPSAVIAFFRGFLLAENSFALFCAVFAATLGPLSLATAVVAALVSQLGLQGIILWRIMRSGVSPPNKALHHARTVSGRG